MKATLTIEDSDGSLDISLEFDPPITDETEESPAGYYAVKCLEFLQEFNASS